LGAYCAFSSLSFPSFLRVVGILIKGGAVRSIRFERWSQSQGAWESLQDIPMLQPPYPKGHLRAEWCWDWQGAELAAPETVPRANFGRRFV
jgi:hypothetical protein